MQTGNLVVYKVYTAPPQFVYLVERQQYSPVIPLQVVKLPRNEDTIP
jgi:hypothetical protein